MRILLDECVPAPVAQLLPDHQVSTVQSQGWSGTTNGALLTLAEAQFDVFVTADQNLIYQQNLTSRKIAVVQLSTNNLRRIKAAASVVVTAVSSCTSGNLIRVHFP